jgi:hypothetical protein
VFKKIALSYFVLAALIGGQVESTQAQSGPNPGNLQQPGQGARPAGVPDDLRLNLMIRNAVVALSQANLTGNYSVLRDMGTPNFQMTNSSARLAEVFSALRTRKLDLSPVMFFSPKLVSPPSLQEGQVLRLTGFFPTAPEQVNFDLAFQLSGEQWMLAGIAVSTESPQASALPPGQPAPAASADASASGPAKPGEAKPIRIDLSAPVPPAQPVAPKKGTAVKKPKPRAQQTAAAQSPSADQPAQPPAPQSETPAEKPAPKSSDTGSSWNPFAR